MKTHGVDVDVVDLNLRVLRCKVVHDLLPQLTRCDQNVGLVAESELAASPQRQSEREANDALAPLGCEPGDGGGHTRVQAYGPHIGGLLESLTHFENKAALDARLAGRIARRAVAGRFAPLLESESDRQVLELHAE